MTIGGAISLVIGVLGIFKSISVGINPWALAILGLVFFFAGISLLKYRTSSK